MLKYDKIFVGIKGLMRLGKTVNNYIYYTALLVWAVFSIAILVYVSSLEGRSVYPLYYNVGNAWNSGQDLYSGKCLSYSYWPGFALVFGFLAKLPYAVGSCVWSALNLLSIFLGMRLLAGCVFGNNRIQTGWFMLLGLPLLFEGILNQQSNSLVAGIVLLGMVCVYKEWYFCGSLLLLFSGVSKIAPLAFALLYLVMYPRELWWRYILALLLLLALPSIFGGSDYVLGQHGSWIKFLGGETSERWEYRDLLVLLELISKGEITRNFHDDFPLWYRMVQLLGAGVLCLICMWLRYVKGVNRRSVLTVVALSGSVWWLLLGPSTEIATCVAGVAAAGLGVLLARDSGAGWWLMLSAYICIALGSNGDYEWYMRQLTSSEWIFGILPFGAVLLYLWVCLYAGKALLLTSGKKDI